MFTRSPIKQALVGLSVLALTACAQSPTGRSQLLMMNSSQMAQLGSQSFEELKKKEKIERDPAINRYVNCVTDALLKHVPKQEAFKSWEVVVFDSKQVNAFALPGGKIGVYTGLLKVAKNEDQLAAVIGHEIGHVLAKHSNERVTQQQLAGVGMMIGGVALANSEHKELAIAALGAGITYGIILPWGRTQESESDIIGLHLMTEAGFNPRESVSLWQNMAKASKGAPPEFLSTHPSSNTRIKDLREEIPKLPLSGVKRPQCNRPANI